jgi:hypothetical protein
MTPMKMGTMSEDDEDDEGEVMAGGCVTPRLERRRT